MNNKLFVGNLAFTTNETELTALFAAFGEVTSCKIATDRDTGRPRGFGFVEMNSQEAAEAAIKGLHGHELGGRQLNVNIAQPKPSRDGGGGGRRY
jgi:RNA recognition motif-containing protein